MGDITRWTGIGADILRTYLESETEGQNPDSFGVDGFINDFEDEFVNAADEAVMPWKPEAFGAFEQMPWGRPFGERPKVHELNQPPKAQELGWRVLELYPNRDFPSEFYRLGGTPAELRLLLQMTQIVRFSTGRQIIFEEWFEGWEKGFLRFNENRTAGNFQQTGEQQWLRIKEPEKRPKYKDWMTSRQRADLGFRTIEYWPDRSQENTSYLLSGTDLQLIKHIVQIEYKGNTETTASFAKGGAEVGPTLKGQPLISLYFSQDSSTLQAGKSLTTSEISFRVMGKTDDPKSPLEKITKNDISLYAQRIKEKFSGPPLYSYTKGKKVVSYRNRYQGFEGWYLVNTKSDGIDLIKRLLYITNQAIDETKIKFSQTENEINAFPDNPGTTTILGQQVKLESERPIVKVFFQKAEIRLSKLKKPIPLVNRGAIMFP